MAKTTETQKLAELLTETLNTVNHEIAALEAVPSRRIASYIRQTEDKIEVNLKRLEVHGRVDVLIKLAVVFWFGSRLVYILASHMEDLLLSAVPPCVILVPWVAAITSVTHPDSLSIKVNISPQETHPLLPCIHCRFAEIGQRKKSSTTRCMHSFLTWIGSSGSTLHSCNTAKRPSFRTSSFSGSQRVTLRLTSTANKRL